MSSSSSSLYTFSLNLFNFTPTEQPTWRQSSTPRTSEMLEAIGTFETRYLTLNGKQKQTVKTFTQEMAILAVSKSNELEDLGIKSYGDTRIALEDRISTIDSEVARKETRQTYDTMEYLYSTMKFNRQQNQEDTQTEFTTARHAVLLDEDSIRHAHLLLLRTLKKQAGSYRINAAESTNPVTHQTHYYPPPTIIRGNMASIVDTYNNLVHDYGTTVLGRFKIAAWLLFHFVDLHPFNDGNGRMCRLLANYSLSAFTPFPIAIYPNTNNGAPMRETYLKAIQSCRDNPKRTPDDLAAIIIERAYTQWTELFKQIDALTETNELKQ